MRHERTDHRWLGVIPIVMVSATVFLTPALANAQVSVDDGCMQDLAGFNLVCTANDIQISNVTNLVINDDGCAFPGDTVDFTAEFTVLTTAKRRFDVGLYFATDGDPNGDGAVSGTCSISTMPFAPDPPWLDLDGTDDDPGGVIQDECGDIDKPDHNPLLPTISFTNVLCVDDDGDGFLDLPNCTSWRQTGANELCLSPLDAFPGSPSKCRCDIGFNVPIEVPPATLLVDKTANPTSVTEPGGPVTFTVIVTNTGIDPNNDVTLNLLSDDIYGDVTTTGHDGITDTTCALPQILQGDDGHPGGIDTYQCTFTVDVAGNGRDTITDTVTASGVDSHDNAISGEDDATVTITDVTPTIAVEKSADPTEVFEPGDDVTFTVNVTNNSVSSDPVTIDSLTDDIHGDLNGQGDCSVPQVIASGDTYTCAFVDFVGGMPGDSETDTVTAAGTDDEGNAVSDSDSATVNINDVPSMITLIKSADPTSVDEPGGSVVYEFMVMNTSAVDTVTIDTLIDDILGDLTLLPPPDGGTQCSVLQVIPPAGAYTCQVEQLVEGDAADTDGVTNVATASGLDDDGNPVSDDDDANVGFNNVPPMATLTKTPTTAIVTFVVAVTNDSEAEALTLNALNDDMFGDVTQVQGNVLSTTCAVPQSLEISGTPGDTYTCEFDAVINTSPHTDEVTGDVDDNDGSATLQVKDTATVTFN